MTPAERERLKAAVDRATRERVASLVCTRTAWSPSTILDVLRAFHAREGRVPTVGDLVAPKMPSARSVRRYFHTLDAAIAAAGLNAFEVEQTRLFEIESSRPLDTTRSVV